PTRTPRGRAAPAGPGVHAQARAGGPAPRRRDTRPCRAPNGPREPLWREQPEAATSRGPPRPWALRPPATARPAPHVPLEHEVGPQASWAGAAAGRRPRLTAPPRSLWRRPVGRRCDVPHAGARARLEESGP